MQFATINGFLKETETALALLTILKVSKFRKQIFLFSFERKNERNYFLNSALASKMSQIKKNEGTLSYYLGGI